MSRSVSPHKAARLAERAAERAAEEARRQRKEKRRTLFMLAGIGLLMLVTYAAWLIIEARVRHSRHHHQQGATNPAAAQGKQR